MCSTNRPHRAGLAADGLALKRYRVPNPFAAAGRMRRCGRDGEQFPTVRQECCLRWLTKGRLGYLWRSIKARSLLSRSLHTLHWPHAWSTHQTLSKVHAPTAPQVPHCSSFSAIVPAGKRAVDTLPHVHSHSATHKASRCWLMHCVLFRFADG